MFGAVRAIRAFVVLCSGLYVLVVYLSYILLVHPRYGYMGFTYNPTEPVYRLACAFLALLPSFWMPIDLRRPSVFLYWLLYVFVVVPSCIVPMLAGMSHDSAYLVFLMIEIFCFFIVGLSQRFSLIPKLVFPAVQRIYWPLFGTVALFFTAYLLSSFWANVGWLSLDRIYEARSRYKEIVAELGGPIGYVTQWQMNVISPILIGIGVLRRDVLIGIVGVALQIVIYTITGFKSVLFSLFLIPIVPVITWRKGAYIGPTILVGVIALTVFAFLESGILGSGHLVAHFLERTVMAQGLLTGCYFSYFTDNITTELGQSFLRPLVGYPYDLELPNLIGYSCLGSAEVNANSHLFSDGFASFGYLGMVLFSFLLAFVLWTYDVASQNQPIRLTVFLLALPAVTLCNAQLLTTLSTHGLGLLILLVYLMPRLSGRTGKVK